MEAQQGTVGTISGINGSVVHVKGFSGHAVGDMVEISEKLHLMGEIIKIVKDIAVIQCYEETSGLRLHAQVINKQYPLSMEMGPGLLNSIYDGIQRPLKSIAQISGNFIARGVKADALDQKKKWLFHPHLKVGDAVVPGDFIGQVKEFSQDHMIMIPPGVSGTIHEIKEGNFTIMETVYSLKDDSGQVRDFTMMTRWPIRKPRPYAKRLFPDQPLLTGTRVFDLLFPVARGGSIAIPGGYGTGKTVCQHSLAKFSDADVIIYIGCGERGNEMADLLTSMPLLQDTKNHRPLMERTIMIANTSNMPVSAREASIFSGITLAEYWRDMGKNVLLLADSTSRWAEALREISGGLEEMPTEGGYPAYLAAKLSSFYERAGLVVNQGSPERIGAITIVGAVSPPGGNFSEPVTTNTKRFVKVFWALDSRLAYARHYPSVNPWDSYSEYINLASYWEENIEEGWEEARQAVSKVLATAHDLESTAKLVGIEALPPSQQLSLFISDLINNAFLIQNGFNENDRYCSPSKMMKLINIILQFHAQCLNLLELNVPMFRFREMECLNEIRRARLDISSEETEKLDQLLNTMMIEFSQITAQYADLSADEEEEDEY